MGDAFLTLSKDDKREALGVAADRLGRPPYLVEKDVWVVWTLDQLFRAPFGSHLVFKGGTSLSKAHGGVIQRFSEDIDLTFDIRALLGLEDSGDEVIPSSRSQAKKLSDDVREKLPLWIANVVVPHLADACKRDGCGLAVRYDDGSDKVRITYPSQTTAQSEYVKSEILLEFGARSTGEPAEVQEVVCDAAKVLQQVVFPTASPRVMAIGRTFWEKLTLIHVYCVQEDVAAARYARHWYDLSQLYTAGIAAVALADRTLGNQVADHKQRFFRETAPGTTNPYADAVGFAARLVPTGASLDALRADYQQMLDGGLIQGGAPTFDQIIANCRQIETLANTR